MVGEFASGVAHFSSSKIILIKRLFYQLNEVSNIPNQFLTIWLLYTQKKIVVN